MFSFLGVSLFSKFGHTSPTMQAVDYGTPSADEGFGHVNRINRSPLCKDSSYPRTHHTNSDRIQYEIRLRISKTVLPYIKV